jgi:hypothetical protein
MDSSGTFSGSEDMSRTLDGIAVTVTLPGVSANTGELAELHDVRVNKKITSIELKENSRERAVIFFIRRN